MSETTNGAQTVKLNFTFPVTQVNEPVLATAVKRFGVQVDIRRAQVEENVGGYIMCSVTGTDEQIDNLVQFLKSAGVGVGFIGSDEVQAY
ncbi:MAG: NIL domain-containing protein [Capsulimonadaceae bacterium]|nr:NIL domain-containing protein [Capsulimonadaceae bacterium]